MSKKAALAAERAARMTKVLAAAQSNPSLVREVSIVVGGNIELKIDIYEEMIRRSEWRAVMAAKCSPNLYADIMDIVNREE